MGRLGGDLLGKDGLGSFDGGEILGQDGLEGFPDGKAGGGVDNLLVNDSGDARLINDSGDVRLFING